MEKVYMEAPKQTSRGMWRPEDISPYDFRDDGNKRMDSVEFDENEFDMDSLLHDMNQIDEMMDDEDIHERDMYENNNIDWQCNEDVSQRNYQNQIIERKTIIEEDNPKRTTTTWMRVTRQY